MFQTLIDRVAQFVQVRRATTQLSVAIVDKNLEAMRLALDNGARPEKAHRTFYEPFQHFPMTYMVEGALELAVHERLPLEGFQLLLDAGARPLGEGALLQGDARRWSLASEIDTMVEAALINDQTTAVATAPRASARL